MICYGAFMGSKKAGKLTWDELLDEYFSRETYVQIRNGVTARLSGDLLILWERRYFRRM